MEPFDAKSDDTRHVSYHFQALQIGWPSDRSSRGRADEHDAGLSRVEDGFVPFQALRHQLSAIPRPRRNNSPTHKLAFNQHHHTVAQVKSYGQTAWWLQIPGLDIGERGQVPPLLIFFPKVSEDVESSGCLRCHVAGQVVETEQLGDCAVIAIA